MMPNNGYDSETNLNSIDNIIQLFDAYLLFKIGYDSTKNYNNLSHYVIFDL